MMDWPIGWTDLKPLAMAKFQQWLQQHGGCLPNNPNQGGTMNIHPDKSRVTVIQSRAEMNYKLVGEYAREMKNVTNFDAVKAIRADNGHFYIYDGAHRVEAARKINYAINIEWTPGTLADAEWLALSANQKHGLRRNTKDKQRIVYNALRHPNGATLSNREIGRHCGVDHKTVGRIRADLVTSGEIPQIAEREVTRNGKTFTQTAKAEPAYADVWQLEASLQNWLNTLSKMGHKENFGIDILKSIKKGDKKALRDMMAGDALPTPRRKRDVVQAVNNVLDQLQQAAKAEPEYVNISQLEQSIRAWLNKEWPDSPADRWAVLHNIKKQRTTTNPFLNGPALLEKLQVGSILPGPRRKGDVRQACNNVLDQMNQATKARPCVRCGTTELGEGWHPYGDTRYCGKCWQERKALIEADAKQKRNNHIATLTCLACAPTFDPAAWARDRAQDTCLDCLRALGEALIEAAKEIEFQN